MRGKWAWVGPAALVVLYATLRIALIPDNAEFSWAFGHDSSYLAIVARNLLGGRGFVNDASWLVWMQPDSLPVPLHNANPLFIMATAALARASGAGVIASGFVLSALSSALLVLSVTVLTQHYTRNWWASVSLGFAGALFPLALGPSLTYLTDGLFTALFFAFLAALVRVRPRAAVVWTGVFLGLTWLTRAAVVLALPAVVVFLLLRVGWRHTLVRLAVMGSVAAVVASPWLIRNWRVWGNPLYGETGPALLQDYYGRQLGFTERFWHSPERPPGLGHLIRERPGEVVRLEAHGIRELGEKTLRMYSRDRLWIGLLVFGAVASFVMLRRPRASPEVLALGTLAGVHELVFALRSENFEYRYFVFLSVFVGVVAAAGCWAGWRTARGHRLGKALGPVVAALGVVLWLVAIPLWVLGEWRLTYRENEGLTAMRQAAARVETEFAHGSPVVVGIKPYYYTLETGTSALSFPYASDDYLLRYMDQYGANYILLTDWELDFWRPAWREPAALPDGLEPVARFAAGGRKCAYWCDSFVFGRVPRSPAPGALPDAGPRAVHRATEKPG